MRRTFTIIMTCCFSFLVGQITIELLAKLGYLP